MTVRNGSYPVQCNLIPLHSPFPKPPGASWADDPYSRLLRGMKSSGDLDNAVLFFLSDHGFRFGPFAKTDFGEMENNLPFLFVVLPKAFKRRFPELVVNLHRNARKLITPFDTHKTLQHLLHLQTIGESGWRNNDAEEGKKGNERVGQKWGKAAQNPSKQEAFSLFTDDLPNDRTCERAGIPDAFCSCYRRVKLDVNSPIAIIAASALLRKINVALKDVEDACVKWKLQSVVKAKQIAGKQLYVVQISASGKINEERRVEKPDTTLEREEEAPTRDRPVNEAYEEMGEEEDEEVEEEGKIGEELRASFEGWVRLEGGVGGNERVDDDGGILRDSYDAGQGHWKREDGRLDLVADVKLESISRLDRYGKTSECVVRRKPSIKHLCLCKKFLAFARKKNR